MTARPSGSRTYRRAPLHRFRQTLRWCCGAMAGGLALSALDAIAAPELERVGPLWVSAAGRDRVRGGRPDGTSVLVAWAPGIDDPEKEARDALAAFERATFPEQRPASTLVDRPPDPWMEKLVRPDFPVRWNRKTVEYLRYFRDHPRGQALMRAWMRRAGRYEARLRQILAEAGVPEDLVFVALAESGFNPRVRSRVGAGGLWQFMEATGQVYGLRQDFWVDERFDIEKSTWAAALYLKDLRVRFGSWELALAAYNAGYGLVMTTIDRHNTNNFWALAEIESGLPHATTNYVPKIVAAALVGRNRAVFGCSDQAVDRLPKLDWVEVQVQSSTSIDAIADVLGEDPALLVELNAHLVRGRTPPRHGSFPVRIPASRLATWNGQRHRLTTRWESESAYTIREGESLTTLARRLGIDEKELRNLNGIRDSGEVGGGTTLVIPAGAAPMPFAAQERPLVAVPHVEPGAGKRLVFHETVRATTPSSLATAFGVRWDDIVRWNDLDPQARLQPGQLLQLVVAADFDANSANVIIHERQDVELVTRGSREHIEAELRRRDLVRRGYRVRKGDTLEKIGRRFDLTEGDIARINGIPRTQEPVAGDILVIYVPRGKLRGTVGAPEPPAVYAGPAAAPTQAPARRRPSTAATALVPGSGTDSTELEDKPRAGRTARP